MTKYLGGRRRLHPDAQGVDLTLTDDMTANDLIALVSAIAPYFAAGTNPASDGPIRIPNNVMQKARNAANNANLDLIGYDSSNNPKLFSGLTGVLKASSSVVSASGIVNADVDAAADIAMTKLQPHEFLAHLTSSASNVTGDGTAYTVPFNAEVYDVSSAHNTSTGVFTAPVTGRYHFEFLLTLNGLGAAHNIGYPELVTSNKTFRGTRGNLGAMRDSTNAMSVALSVTCDMDANDTAHVSVVAAGGTKVVAVAGDASVGETYFSGYQAG